MKINNFLAAALFAIAMVGARESVASCSNSGGRCGMKREVRQACPLGYAHDKDYGCLDYSGYVGPDCESDNQVSN